jgi:SCP-2 sterol transfer family
MPGVPLPPDLTPQEFFESYLPDEWGRARGDGGGAGPDATVEVDLTGDGGGTWTVAITGGALTVTAAPASGAPDLRIRLSVADFRAALWGEPGAPEVFGADLDLGAALARIPRAPAGLPALTGAVRVDVTGFAGRAWSITAELGGATAPEATVTIDADTVVQMRRGQINPAAAFFGGKVQLGGDVGWIMQAGMGFMGGRGGVN